MPAKRATAYLSLILVAAIWGAAGPVIKYVLTDIPPVLFVTYRFFLSTLIALFLFPKTLSFPSSPTKTWNICVYSFFSVILGIGVLFFGFDKTSSLSGSLIAATTPIFATIAGYLFLKEKVTKIERIGTVIAFAGTIITIVAPLLAGTGSAVWSLEGNTLVLIAVLSDVAGWLIGKKVLRDNVPALQLTNLSFLFGFLIFLPITLFLYGPTTMMSILAGASVYSHLGVLFMAVASGMIAYFLRNLAIKTIEVSEASLFTYLMPLFAVPLSIFWLKESVDIWFILGTVVIVAGVVLAEYKKRHTHTSKSRQTVHLRRPHRNVRRHR